MQQEEFSLKTSYEELCNKYKQAEATLETCSSVLEEQFQQHQQELELSIASLQEEMNAVNDELDHHRKCFLELSYQFVDRYSENRLQELKTVINSLQEHIAQYVKDAQQIKQHLEELDGYW